MTIEFVVPGKCIGKQRPRFSRIGKFVHTYTPQYTKDYEKEVIKAYNKEADGKKLKGAVKAEISLIFEPPKSISKKKRKQMIDGEIPYTKKIDLDNGIKSILDGLNTIAYEDDSCVDSVYCTKSYGETSETRVRLTDERHVIKPLIFYEENDNKGSDDGVR